MNIYKLNLVGSDCEVVTAESQEQAIELSDTDVETVQNCGPYLSESAYQEVRSEIL